MVFTEQQLQVKKLVDVQQDIEIDALNDGVGALSSTMQNGFTEAANNFSDIQNSLEAMNLVGNDRYNEFTGSVNTLSNAMTQGFLDMGNTVANVSGEIQGQINNVNIELQNIQNNFELVNTNIGESINAYNDQITNSLSVDTLSANTLIYNISAAPVSSLTALGYDSNGRVIPVTVIANQNIVLPENAKYLYTDSVGTPYAGMADTAVSTNETLVTSHAVYNAVNDIWTDLNSLHNEVSNSSNVQNLFNDVNNSINDMNVGIQNQFIDVWANFDSVNDSISGIDNALYPVLNYLGAFTPLNYINSNSPVNYMTVENVVFAKGTTGNLWSPNSSIGNKYYDWNSTTNTLKFYSPTGIIVFNSNMSQTFASCTNLNQNIQILNGVTDMHSTFNGCTSLNQNILIPSSVTNMHSTFDCCTNLNQNIYLYSDKINNIRHAFTNCSLLSDKYIHIRSSIPMSASNDIYNSLVNNFTDINWSGRIINDLPEPTTWPPVN